MVTAALIVQCGLDWLRPGLGGLRDEQAVECLAVLPEPKADQSASDYAKRTWAEFDVAGLFYAERSPTADLLRAMGIRPADDSARLPLAVGASDV